MRNDDYHMNFEDESRRSFVRDFLAYTGWVFVGGTQLMRSPNVAVAGDPNNQDQNYGGIKGRILSDGTPPERKEIDLESQNLAAQDMAWFKKAAPILNEDWVIDPKTKAVQWVFVWLQPLGRRDEFALHESQKVIPDKEMIIPVDQDPQGYVPHAVAAREGQGLLMRNKGPIAHAFKFEGWSNPQMNQAMPPGAEIPVKNLKAERAPVKISCPPHPWERMYLRVFDHPYFAVTKPDGTFEINMAPKGPCRLVVWQETLGFNGGRSGRDGSEITIEGGAISDLGDIKIKA